MDWRWRISGDTLVIELPRPFVALSWAPLGAGLRRVRAILNHHVGVHQATDVSRPASYLERVARGLGLHPHGCVGMMTGVEMSRCARAGARRGALAAAAWCTAGCSNALRVGDPATVETTWHAGTINLVVLFNQPLSEPAMVEAMALAVEARVAAVQAAGVRSTRTDSLATGTGTDCVTVAAPSRGRAHPYCGKHTRAGELIGRAALAACTRALARSAR